MYRAFDQCSGLVDYTNAPWFDWGPYLWASRGDPRNFDGLLWCNGQNEQLCNFGQQKDVRYGDTDPTFWGDFTHPSAMGAEKVANQLRVFIGKDPSGMKPGSPFATQWIQK
jgi:hypothetical protein